jgi:hypothetical protein
MGCFGAAVPGAFGAGTGLWKLTMFEERVGQFRGHPLTKVKKGLISVQGPRFQDKESAMRSERLAGLAAASLMAAVFALGAAAPSLADTYDRDRVYADSFGNLVIVGASGYKRIVVGEGHQAGNMSGNAGGSGPEVVYANGVGDVVSSPDCYRPPVFVKGRSYMYGFDQGEIPLQGGPCR